jgi:hypothetical protein
MDNIAVEMLDAILIPSLFAYFLICFSFCKVSAPTCCDTDKDWSHFANSEWILLFVLLEFPVQA